MTMTLKRRSDSATLMYTANVSMPFYLATTIALRDVYGVTRPVFEKPFGAENYVVQDGFCELVDAVFSYPHPFCLAWAWQATQIYENLTDHNELWEWPVEMAPYEIDWWHADEAIKLKSMGPDDRCIAPSQGPSGRLHTYRNPVGAPPDDWGATDEIDVICGGIKVCSLQRFEAKLFVRLTDAYEDITQLKTSSVQLVGDKIEVHSDEFLNIVERVMMAYNEHTFEWCRLATAIVDQIAGERKRWLFMARSFPLMIHYMNYSDIELPYRYLTGARQIESTSETWDREFHRRGDWSPVLPKVD